MQAPGGKDEDRDGGFERGGWTLPYWHDDIGAAFGALMKDVDALLLGRRTYVTHAEAFEPMPVGDPFGDMMNAPKKYVVSKTLEEPPVAQHDDHPGQCDRLGAQAEGGAGPEHCYGREQSARARAARARPRRRTAPSALPADRGKRKTGLPPRHDGGGVRIGIRDAIPERSRRAPLHA